MSQQNVEDLRAFLEPWSEEPWALERWQNGEVDISIFAADVAYEDMNLPDHVGETYHGHAGVVRAAERWVEPFEWLLVELEEIVDAGDDLVPFIAGERRRDTPASRLTRRSSTDGSSTIAR